MHQKENGVNGDLLRLHFLCRSHIKEPIANLHGTSLKLIKFSRVFDVDGTLDVHHGVKYGLRTRYTGVLYKIIVH